MGLPYKYGRGSKLVFRTLHPALQQILLEVLKYYDHSLLRGIRDVEQQREYVRQGLSKTMDSRHLPGGGYQPNDPDYPDRSYAVDVAPFINGKVSYNHKEVAHFMGYVQRVADEMGIAIRWGGDWDKDRNQREHTFWDGVHIELQRSVYN